MLVRRSIPEPPPTEPESIQSRLSRLRLEQRTGSRPLFTTPTSASSSTSSTLLHGHPSFRLSYPNSIPITNSRKGPAGPPPPPSWRKLDSKRSGASSAKSKTSSRKGKEREADKRRAYLLPLESPVEDNEVPTPWISPHSRAVPSLKEICYGLIASDLEGDLSESIYVDYLGSLPAVFRLEIIDIAAVYYPLSEAGIKALLWGDEYWDQEGTPPTHAAESVGTEDSEAEWETTVDMNLFESFPSTLTRLNLCGSSITLSGLRRLLLSPSSSSSSIDHPPSSHPARRPNPNFPNLTTLILSSTPNIPFRPPFFDLLSTYLSLRHLSLSGKSLDPSPTSSTTTSTSLTTKDRWLSRLASSTPNLITLDLSFIDCRWNEAFVSIDWRTSWREMKMIGVREGLEVSDRGEEVGMMMRRGRKEREAKLRELYASLRESLVHRKRWLEFVI